MIHAFIYGVILAFGLIMPLGVQNIFVFNQGATQRNFIYALPSVIAASLCDTVLIILAVLGVSVAVLSIPWLKTAIFIVGFFFLLYIGWVTWKSSPAKLSTQNQPLSAKKQFGFAISVSLLNPHAVIDSVGVLGPNALHFIGADRWAFTIACILVSWIWFAGLSIAGHFFHQLDKTGVWLMLVNKLSAIIIWSVALYIGWQLLI